MASITATSSPIWLDCAGPGTLIALFLGLSWANQMLLLHCAFVLPLLRQAPSVWMLTSWCFRFAPGSTLHFARNLDMLLGFEKIRKHSVRSFLVVIEGSKVINSFWYHACRFFLFLDAVERYVAVSIVRDEGGCIWGKVRLFCFALWKHTYVGLCSVLVGRGCIRYNYTMRRVCVVSDVAGFLIFVRFG